MIHNIQNVTYIADSTLALFLGVNERAIRGLIKTSFPDCVIEARKGNVHYWPNAQEALHIAKVLDSDRIVDLRAALIPVRPVTKAAKPVRVKAHTRAKPVSKPGTAPATRDDYMRVFTLNGIPPVIASELANIYMRLEA